MEYNFVILPTHVATAECQIQGNTPCHEDAQVTVLFHAKFNSTTSRERNGDMLLKRASPPSLLLGPWKLNLNSI